MQDYDPLPIEGLIPDQKKLYNALRESEYRYSQLIQGLPAAIYTCDAKGRIMLYNKAATQLWGRTPKIGKDLWCGSWRIYRTDGTPLPLDRCPMAITLKEGRAVVGEEIVVERPDGIRRHVLAHPKPILDASDTVVGAINMLVDITEHKHAQNALMESEERFRTMADQAPIIIWMSDNKGKNIYHNSKWYEFTGTITDKGTWSDWVDFIHPDDKENAYKKWYQALENQQHCNFQFRYRNSTGDYRIMNANCTPRISKNGEFIGYISILNDVTLQENAKSLLENLIEERTKDLVSANIKLENSNQELEQFAYVASHDLQEPLRKIRTFADRLQETGKEKLDAQTIMYLDKIIHSANRMTDLINDLLDYSRSARIIEQYVKLDLNKVLKDVLNDFDLLISQKQAIIKCDPLPAVEAVPLQMSQLFNNLISNSLKFSKSGRIPIITISSNPLAEMQIENFNLDKKQSYHELLFSDNGIGFKEEFSERIFEIFQRLNPRKDYSGSGIGLSICRKIVFNHHGIIFAESNDGEGATFHVILPANQIEQ